MTLSLDRSRQLQEKAHRLIPGGSHTYAKGDDQYPEQAPGFLVRGSGSHVWDPDGNEYIEYGMGLRAVTLGHAYPSVVEAAYKQMLMGANFIRPAPIEVECAERLLSFIPAADMVKFAKDGSTVNTAALTLARAYTGRDMVAVCADHPFFSYNDWFMGTTPVDAGIPKVIKDLTVTFSYNNLDSVRELFEKHPGRIACLIMEPAKNADPKDGFLHKTQELCHQNGALFILDEMITGFRVHQGGGQRLFDVEPDLSTWGKALANGFALSALAGKREIMELGGLHHNKERVFLLSTTHGAEAHAMAAAIATMCVYEHEPVIEHLYRVGERLANGVNQAIDEYSLQGYVAVMGRPCNLMFATRDQNKKDSQAFRALLMQELIRRGVIGPSFIVSYSHSDADIDFTIEAVAGALNVYRRALEDGVEAHLMGRPLKPVYRRYN
jgi:glutamate-1-semialdehyde 2,1-aminomutase